MEDYSLYADEEELYEDEEVEAIEEEGSNRTFIILVGSLGGLLAVAICIFAVWAFVINPRMTANIASQNHDIEATNEALMAEAGILTGTVSLEDTATDTPIPEEPTAMPEPTEAVEPPTATPKPPAPTPIPETATLSPEESTEEAAQVEATEMGTPAAVAEANTATPRPTTASQATATPKPGKAGVPETGIGAVGASVLAMGLLFLLMVVRRLRHAA